MWDYLSEPRLAKNGISLTSWQEMEMSTTQAVVRPSDLRTACGQSGPGAAATARASRCMNSRGDITMRVAPQCKGVRGHLEGGSNASS